MSQEELAWKVGLKKMNVYHLEVGRRELKVLELVKFCEVLNLDLKEVLEKSKIVLDNVTSK